MNLVRSPACFKNLSKPFVASIGNFDGMHLGHQALIDSLKHRAQALQLPAAVILFEPQPLEYFDKGTAPARLSCLREKLAYLKKSAVDTVFCFKFSKELAETEASDFFRHNLCQRLSVHTLIVGADFRFGRGRVGDLALLKELAGLEGCSVIEAADYCLHGLRVSSTQVRRALAAGDCASARRMLGRTYSLSARVVYGQGLGRSLGVPTANLNTGSRSLPLRGVFVVQVKVLGCFFPAVANAGFRPTVQGISERLEVHLLDFNKSLYGQRMEVFFLHKLREEKKFSSLEELKTQIHEDLLQARAFFSRTHIVLE